MADKDVSIHDAEYWKRMPLSLADAVLVGMPKTEEPYKSEFRDFIIDLSGQVPNSYGRTITGRRIDFSVLECDLDTLEEVFEHLAELKGKGAGYQAGYTRDYSHGKPRLKYIQTVNGQEVRDIVF
jgi:hypothetical protein